MQWILSMLIVAVLSTPTLAFVSRIDPDYPGSRIGCGEMHGLLVLYIRGNFPGGQAELKAQIALANGYTGADDWTAQDNTDFLNLGNLLQGLTQGQQYDVANAVRGVCSLWELRKYPFFVNAVNPQNIYRTALSLQLAP